MKKKWCVIEREMVKDMRMKRKWGLKCQGEHKYVDIRR